VKPRLKGGPGSLGGRGGCPTEGKKYEANPLRQYSVTRVV
jgi:hypothetical protein